LNTKASNSQSSTHDYEHQHKHNVAVRVTENKEKVKSVSDESDSFVFSKKEIEVLAKSASSSSSPETQYKDYDIEYEPITKSKATAHTTFNSTETAVNELVTEELTELEVSKRKVELKELREQIRDEKQKLMDLIKKLDNAEGYGSVEVKKNI
jgi:hypothetical protein